MADCLTKSSAEVSSEDFPVRQSHPLALVAIAAASAEKRQRRSTGAVVNGRFQYMAAFILGDSKL